MRCTRRAALGALLGSAAIGCRPERAAPGGVRRIVYWEKWTDFEGQAMDRVVDRFNVEQRERAARERGYAPIEVERVTVSKIEQKLLVAVAGGNPPDVAGLYGYMMAAYASKGALVDLTPRLAAAGISGADYLPRYFDLGVYRDRVWALPSTPASIALHWNQRLFRDAGLDPERGPSTIEELDVFAERLTRWEVTGPDGSKRVERGYLPHVPAERKRLVQIGFSLTNPEWWPYLWGAFFGGRLIEPDGRVGIDSPDNLRAYEWAASHSRKIGVEAYQRFRSGFGKFSSPQNPFLSGKVAMQLQGVWMHNYVDKYAPGLAWGAGPFPTPANRPELAYTTLAETDNLVIPRGSRHPDEAFEFIRFVNSRPVMESLCLGQRKFTPLTDVSDAFWTEHAHPRIRLFRDLGASPNAVSTPKIGSWTEYIREMNSAMDAIVNLSAPPAVVLGGVRARMQAAVDRERRALERRERGAKPAPRDSGARGEG